MIEKQMNIAAKYRLKYVLIIIGFFYLMTQIIHIILPLIFAILLSILLLPVVDFFTRKLKFNKLISIISSLVIFIMVALGVLLLIASELRSFINEWPIIKTNVLIHFEDLQQWVNKTININYLIEQGYLKQMTEKGLEEAGKYLGDFIGSFTDVFLNLVIIPIYTFLLLWYKKIFVNAIYQWFNEHNHTIITRIFMDVKKIIRNYMNGLLLEMLIVSALVSTGFYFIGIKQFLFLGLVTGILNAIPYLGILMASLLSMAVALAGSPEITILGAVLIVILAVQILDNNFLVPKIIGSQVRLNALVTMLGIIVGGIISGIAGMFLAIPLLAMSKVIFDNIYDLKPLGYIMGEEE